MNVIKSVDGKSVAMQPFNGLNQFGSDNLQIKLDLTQSLERYLDSKRSTLLFSKGVILVEGDAEEIIIPSLVKGVLGVSLDEIGVSIINIGSTSFEYIASVFSDKRIQRCCAIITDLDEQAVPTNSKLYKEQAAQKGRERRDKLNKLFQDNNWVKSYFAETTFEIELAGVGENIQLYKKAVEELYVNKLKISEWKSKLIDISVENKNEAVLKLADKFGKGWLAVIISQIIMKTNYNLLIPEYIMDALVFASQESITENFLKKLINQTTGKYDDIEEFMDPVNNNNLDFPPLFKFIQKLMLNRKKPADER